MYTELSRTLNEVLAFSNKHCIEAVFNIHTAGDLRRDSENIAEYWATFEKGAGVYIIINVVESNTHYVGMSQSDIGGRIVEWLFSDNKVNEAVSNEDIVLTINLPQEKYISPALESFLIERLSPILNKKR